ncbi:MAG: ABC transporter ATP-binding protein [Paenibacillus dendritiformis]|uniref:ABC transporter ATP-binding protein n=1 Tax=Paenibacillus dendritiformis TaxID=130049 RepID=UPI00143D4565|nr:ABC transporter ATP-binding protein [Paenibacillus dendritiformis]MDU5143750.1 ABC transporter ATP-binding protein [Paenibacillus dendritiformis]NKI20194.1 ABC transporter ATP-binding protein [Paenibacillus dendritiformis]NRF99628.1 ABC transporter ATP-binding protein [Paenibacillus dendritiformis]
MLKVQSLNIRYADKTVVQNFSLDVKEGEVVSIIGPNGSGKSTILKAMTRLIPCESGRVCIADRELRSLSVKQVSRLMCMLCQSNASPPDMTVGELVSYGRMPHKKWYERLDAEDEEVIQWALEQTGMHAYKERLVVSLSGGEAQRAWLAMALAQRPKVLLLDEPTTYLDIAHQLEVLELVRALNRELGLTVVMVLHDLNHASAYSDRVCVIKGGSLRLYGTPQDVFTIELIRSVYGVETEIQYGPDSECPRIHVLQKWNRNAGDVHEAIG